MSAVQIENIIPTSLFMLFSTVTDPNDKSLVARWRREYEASLAKKQRRRAILDAVGEGYDTVSEIVAATGIPDPTARRIIDELEARKHIVRRKTKNEKNRIEFRFAVAA